MENKFRITRFDLKGEVIYDDQIDNYEIKNDVVSSIINNVNNKIIDREIS